MPSQVARISGDCFPDPPLLVAIDIQREYTTEGRPFYLKGIKESLGNCKAVLDHARAQRWPVAHVRHIQKGHVFSETNSCSMFVEGFEPLPHEFLFTKSNFTCYSCAGFANFMEWSQSDRIFIIGYNSSMCCLSTIIDGYNRGHELTFVHDASLARPTSNADERSAHLHVIDIIKLYSEVISSVEVLAIGEGATANPLEAPHERAQPAVY